MAYIALTALDPKPRGWAHEPFSPARPPAPAQVRHVPPGGEVPICTPLHHLVPRQHQATPSLLLLLLLRQPRLLLLLLHPLPLQLLQLSLRVCPPLQRARNHAAN